MLYDNAGYPKDVGATDYYDSARLAGMMALSDCGNMNASLLVSYTRYNEDAVLVMTRHPYTYSANNWKNCTRDQLLPYVAGLMKYGMQGTVRRLYDAAVARGYRAQNTEADEPGTVKKFPNGADLLTPSHMNHLRICAGLRPTLLGKAWLIADIVTNAYFAPTGESNQLISMCVAAGPFYVKLWKKLNKKWEESIAFYWCTWRGEPELAFALIKMLNKY